MAVEQGQYNMDPSFGGDGQFGSQTTVVQGQYPAPAFADFGLPVQSEGSGAPGTAGATEADAITGGGYPGVQVTVPFASSQVAADIPVVTVGVDDVNMPSDSAHFAPGKGALDFTGTVGAGDSGAGRGTAQHFTHPNSLGKGGRGSA